MNQPIGPAAEPVQTPTGAGENLMQHRRFVPKIQLPRAPCSKGFRASLRVSLTLVSLLLNLGWEPVNVREFEAYAKATLPKNAFDCECSGPTPEAARMARLSVQTFKGEPCCPG